MINCTMNGAIGMKWYQTLLLAASGLYFESVLVCNMSSIPVVDEIITSAVRAVTVLVLIARLFKAEQRLQTSIKALDQ